MSNLTARETATLKALLAKMNDTAPAKTMPEGLKAAKVACYEARQARRSDSTRKGGAGMTKAERRALAAELRAQGKNPSDTRTWNAACKAARGL